MIAHFTQNKSKSFYILSGSHRIYPPPLPPSISTDQHHFLDQQVSAAKQTTSNYIWITLNSFPWASRWSKQCLLPVFTGLSGLGWPQANISFLLYLVFYFPRLPGLFPWPQWQVPSESKRHFISSLESSLLPSHCPKKVTWPNLESLFQHYQRVWRQEDIKYWGH